MMLFFGRLDAEKGWTKQLHLGALRNVNTARSPHAWAPTRDSIPWAIFPRVDHLVAYLDLLAQENALPQHDRLQRKSRRTRFSSRR